MRAVKHLIGFLCGRLPVLGMAAAFFSLPAQAGYGTLPLFFQQAPGTNAYLASGHMSQVLIRAGSVDILAGTTPVLRSTPMAFRSDIDLTGPEEIRAIRMTLAGASAQANLTGSAPLTAKVHDLSVGTTDGRLWSQVKATGVYPGIDVLYYGNGQRLEYDFILAPNANPSSIRLQFEGADKLDIDAAGDLILSTGETAIRQHRPVAYQVREGQRVPVKAAYRLTGDNAVEFQIGSYRPDLPLVIDPVLSYSTYFGGNSGELAMAVRTGPDGSIYIAGQTLSRRFLFDSTPEAFQPVFRGGSINGDAFVARFDSTGTTLLYFTYFGGRANDGAFDVAVDAQGNAYITGFTTSGDLPMRNALMPRINGRRHPTLNTFPRDAFVAVLNPSGSDLIYSTYLGGHAADSATGIAVDATGAASIIGTTASTNFPTINEIPGENRRSGGADAFVTKIAPNGDSIVFSTYMGGRRPDSGQGIAVDSQGNVHVTGYTVSPDFPITNAFQTALNQITNRATGGYDAWVAKLSDSGALLYSTFLGGRQGDAGYRIAVDAANAAYITGYTQSKQFPNTLTNVVGMTNARPARVANTDAFLCKVIVNGSGAAELAYAGIMGGNFADVGWDVTVSPSGEAYVVGITTSRNFPAHNATGALRDRKLGGNDSFVFGLSADAQSVLYSGYFGGSRNDYGYGIAWTPAGVLLTGRTTSLDFPTVNPIQDRRLGGNDAFLSILSPDP